MKKQMKSRALWAMLGLGAALGCGQAGELEAAAPEEQGQVERRNMFYNAALQFYRTGQYAYREQDPDLEAPSSGLTLEAWIYPQQSVTGLIAGSEGRYLLGRMSDGTIRWALATSANAYQWVSTGRTAPLNQWTHVAMTYSASASQLRIYFNGLLVSSATVSGLIQDVDPSRNQFRLASQQGDESNTFLGYIDELRVWDVARSQADIQYYAFHRTPSGSAGMRGHWFLDSTSGSGTITTADFSGLGNDLTVMNYASTSVPGRSPLTSTVAPSFQYNPNNGHAYLFYTSILERGGAQYGCGYAQGYHLVTIDDSAEQAWLAARAAAVAPGQEWWIGLNDIATEGTWRWDWGTSSYRNWAPGEPSRAEADCVYTNFSSGWWDDLCTTKRAYICESNN